MEPDIGIVDTSGVFEFISVVEPDEEIGEE